MDNNMLAFVGSSLGIKLMPNKETNIANVPISNEPMYLILFTTIGTNIAEMICLSKTKNYIYRILKLISNFPL